MTTTATPTGRSRRTWRTTLALAGAFALVAAACGDDGDDGAASDDGDAAAADLVLGAPPDCEENPFCLPGLEEVYGVDLSGGFTPLAPETIPDSLLADAIDIGVMFSTDAELADPDLVPLEDDQGLFAAENILPVGSQELDDAYGEDLAAVLDAVSAELTTEGLIELNGRYVTDREDADVVAADWLADHDLDVGPQIDREGPTIRVGAQDFGESVILAEIYQQALEANGFDAQTESVGGFRELLFAAFEGGSVNLAPEYLGSELNYLDAGAATSDVEESLDRLQDLLAEQDLMAWEPADAANSNVFVMTRDRSEELGISSLSDLG